MASRMYSRIIYVKAEFADAGKCWALSSADLPGLLLAGSDLTALLADLPAAIKLLYRLNYQMDVEVAEADQDGREGAAEREQPAKGSFQPLPRAFVAMGPLAA